MSHTLLERPAGARRARPPDHLGVGQDRERLASLTERSMKRESKIGLRGMFTRSKGGRNEVNVGESSSLRLNQRPAGIRASLADFGNWPNRLQPSRSEASLVSTATYDSQQSGSDILSPPRSRQGSSGTNSFLAAAWDPPPLFQVYPQALKHATLPACNIPVEALTRLNDPKNNKRLHRADLYNDPLSDGKGNSARKISLGVGRKHVPEWSEKIFVLVTSGHLLQYAAEGSFNRVPEKVLQLTRSSAAYASDLIPGKHWVLQVVSTTTDSEAAVLGDPKPFRSKLSMKGYERNKATTMLLVYESPEAMDDWLAVFRREIEALGGKKKLSETGRLESNENRAESTEQQFQRAAIVRDPDRFSRVVTRDFSYIQKNALLDPTDDDFAFAPPRRMSAYTVDSNTSPTTSVISSDGQHLDNLRDSNSSHRFSYVSSGQRTIVTSAGSSPECSPTRESFSSPGGDDRQGLHSIPEIRLRPNAAAIVNRRRSMQTLISSFEAPQSEADSRQRPKAPSPLGIDRERAPVVGAPSVRNFSVPHSAGKRFSLSGSVPNGSSAPSHRKTPPPALSMARPLSIVVDQPSPRSPNSMSRSWESRKSVVSDVKDRTPLQHPAKGDRSSASRAQEAVHGNTEFNLTITEDSPEPIEDRPRAASSVGSYGRKEEPPSLPSSYKRASFVVPSRPTRTIPQPTPLSSSSTPSLPISPSRHLDVDPLAHKLVAFRRSMPQLPPMAPPPSCALPPIPQQRIPKARKEI